MQCYKRAMSDSKPNWIASLRESLSGSSSERRHEQRRYIKLPIEVRLTSGATYSGYSRDLSRSSIGAVVSTALDVGQEVWLTFDYPSADNRLFCNVSLQATVRQRLGFRYGFEFTAPLDI